MEINGRILEFEEDSHTYYVDGVKVESVTQILKKKFPDKYANIPESVLKRASDRGVQIHKAIECYCRGFDDGSDEVSDFKFLQKHYGFVPFKTEIPIILDLNGKTYAGRIDLILKTDDDLTLSDIKTTSTLDKEYLGHQLNLYKVGVEQTYGYKISHLWGIHLTNGKRKVVNIPIVDKELLIESLKECL